MHGLAARFSVLQCRFSEFSETFPALLRVWLSRQESASVESTLESLVDALLALDHVRSVDAPLPWVKAIARSALSELLSSVPIVQFKESSVIFSNIPATLSFPWNIPARTRAFCQPTDGEMALLRRNACLEVRVADLEAKAAGTHRPATPAPIREFSTSDDTLYFLQAKRFEAEDAIAVLRKLQAEHGVRGGLMESIGKVQARRIREQARTDASKSRHDMAVATQEIIRLGAEVESLRRFTVTKQAGSADSHPIAPKRALVIAGFWNVTHNDVLQITPHLVSKFEDSGKKVIRRKDAQVCFSAKDRAALIKAVVEVMAEHLPDYRPIAT
jgi:hypothetical protein